MVHVLETSQIIRNGIEPSWDFFSDPRNLAKITPPELDITTLAALPERLYRLDELRELLAGSRRRAFATSNAFVRSDFHRSLPPT